MIHSNEDRQLTKIEGNAMTATASLLTLDQQTSESPTTNIR